MEQNFFLHVLFSWAPISVYWLICFILPGGVSAYYVYQDGIKRMPLALNVHPGWWALICFSSSVWGLLAYWIMQHSSLAKKVNNSLRSPEQGDE